ncbi:MAG: hypothetical protein MR517_05705 [Bacteroidales bacterium]|nr:hypothetical protein [Bacteroidales bacterium]
MEFNEMENCMESGNKVLYQKLQSALYKYGSYKKEDLGERMILVEELKGGYWKPRYLIDNAAETACEFMDSDYCLLTVTADDIAWETIDDLPEKVKERAGVLNAYFPTIIRGYHDGVAEVKWQINPDGRYYMDSDGYGMTDDEEETLYGYIDRKGKPLGKFRRIMEFSELETMKQEAYAKLEDRP